MVYFNFFPLAHAWTITHPSSQLHKYVQTHGDWGDDKSLVRSQSNSVHCKVNPVYSLSLAWPASAGGDSPFVPQWGHNCKQTKENTQRRAVIISHITAQGTDYRLRFCTLVALPGLSWLDWWTTSLTIILAICHAISSWALMVGVTAQTTIHFTADFWWHSVINHVMGWCHKVNLNTCSGEPCHAPQTTESFLNIVNILWPHLIRVALDPFLHGLRKHGT